MEDESRLVVSRHHHDALGSHAFAREAGCGGHAKAAYALTGERGFVAREPRLSVWDARPKGVTSA